MLKKRLLYLLILMTFVMLSACTPSVPQAPIPSPVAHISSTSIPVALSSPMASSTPTVTAVSVTTSLDGLSTLPYRLHWEAKPIGFMPDQIIEVDFLIDDQLAWVELKAPYVYGSDGNYLVPSAFLTPGIHTFTVKVQGVGNRNAASTVKEVVVAGTISPNELVNTSWARDVTQEDLNKSSSGQPPPSGHWSLSIDAKGWTMHDPQGSGGINDVAYPAAGQVIERPSIVEPPYPTGNAGGWCDQPDPEFLWSYVISKDGKTLTLHPVGKDPCGDRTAILEGTWTRINN